MNTFRKINTATEQTLLELGEPVAHTVRRATAAAVIDNPWAGSSVVEDLTAEASGLAASVARALSQRLADALGGYRAIEAFGKAAIVGTEGEIEHGAALIHTPYFGNILRDLVQGTSIITFSDDIGSGGTSLTVPMWHKNHSTTRSHYQTMSARVPDAPRPNEIVMIAAAATGGRPNARIGDRSTDPAITLNDLESSA